MKLPISRSFVWLCLLLVGMALGRSGAVGAPGWSGSAITATNRASVIVPLGYTGLAAENSLGAPRVKFLNATSDLATAVVSFYRAGPSLTIGSASFAATNRFLLAATPAASSGIGQTNGILILRRAATDTYERYTYTYTNVTSAATVSITQFTPGGAGVAIGDQIYLCTLNAAVWMGVLDAGRQWIADPLYVGQDNVPLLIEVNATTLGKITAATVTYEK